MHITYANIYLLKLIFNELHQEKALAGTMPWKSSTDSLSQDEVQGKGPNRGDSGNPMLGA